MKCLTAETTPLARGAADAEHLLSSVVELCDRRVSPEIYGRTRGPETLALMDGIMHFVNAVDDAIVEALDLLCLQVKLAAIIKTASTSALQRLQRHAIILTAA